jgi:hypothetical protein
MVNFVTTLGCGPSSTLPDPVKTESPTENKKSRSDFTEVIAKINRRMGNYYNFNPINSDSATRLHHDEEKKKQNEHTKVVTLSHHPAEEEKKYEGYQSFQII